MKKAIYPGSFDPFHKGHMSVVEKALKIFDYLLVVVSINPDKENQTPIDQRLKLVKTKLKHFKNVDVTFNSDRFIANIAAENNINFLVRSARNKTDFDYELELAAGNKYLNNRLETILIVPDFELINFSSTLERHKRKLGK